MVVFYLIAAGAAFIINLIPENEFLRILPTALYCSVVIAWAMTIRKRILQKSIRNILQIGAVVLVMLFSLRLCHDVFFAGSYGIGEFIHCAYHVCFLTTAQLAFMAALCVGKDDQDKPLKYANYLWILQIVLDTVILTNPLHQQMFTYHEPVLDVILYTYGWFYYFTVAVELLSVLIVFLMLLKKCRISAVRKRWYVPASVILIGVALMIFYLASDGEPELFGLKLYHMQEAFAFIFISGFESLIRIGLIPSNENYEEFFVKSNINAVIYDEMKTELFTSMGYREFNGVENRVNANPIRGGTVLWLEDVGMINRLNDELRHATEEVEEENDLIRQENDLRSERIGYETRNRLYDRIAKIVRPQSEKIDALLLDPDDEKIREKILYAVVLGAYIKRIGNLILLSDEHAKISSAELGLSISESFEYLKLSGVSCDLLEEGECEVSSDVITAAYRLLECVIEEAYGQMNACFVILKSDPEFVMQIGVDAPFDAKVTDRILAFDKAGTSVKVREEDKTVYVTMSAVIEKTEVSKESA